MKKLNKKIWYYLIADFAFQVASWSCLAMTAWYVLEITKSNSDVSILYTINTAGGIAIAFFSGIILDRYCSRSILITINRISILVSVFVFIQVITGIHNIASLFLLALINGFGWNLYFSASKVLLTHIMSATELLQGNSIAELAMQLGTLISAALGGIIYKKFGFESILLVNIGMSTISNVFFKKLDETSQKHEVHDASVFHQKYLTELKTYIKKRPDFFLLGFIMSIPFISSICINVSLAGYAEQNLKLDSIGYGLLDMVFSIGACFAGIILMSGFFYKHLNKIIYAGFLLAIASSICLTFIFNIPAASISIFLLGFLGPGIRILLYTKVMQGIEAAYLPRLLGLWNFISLLVQVFVSFYLGRTLDAQGNAYGFFIYALIMLMGVTLYLLSKCIEKYSTKDLTKINEESEGV